MSEPIPLFFEKPRNTSDRFDAFIEWALPNGTAGITSIHASPFSMDAPYFQWPSSFCGLGVDNARSWLLKHAFLQSGRSVFSRARKDKAPEILDPQGLISPGRFLYFAKAYVNVIVLYRGLRSPPRALFIALSILERALCDQNNGKNDPDRINAVTMERAVQYIHDSDYSSGKKYDIANELEIFSGMIQSGHHTKTFRFSGRGFHLLAAPFTFSSDVPYPRRKRLSTLNSPDLEEPQTPRLTSEEVAAVGLAYAKALSLHGREDQRTFFAALLGLAFCTVSMRMSDLLTLRRDSLYRNDAAGRYRIRIGRPKIDVHQDLPIPQKLGNIANELFDVALGYSAQASEALQFYVERFPHDFDAIDKLYIPPHLAPLFEQEYLTPEETFQALMLDMPTSNSCTFPQRLSELTIAHFVESPGDIWNPRKKSLRSRNRYISIGALVAYAQKKGYKLSLPSDAPITLFICTAHARYFLDDCTQDMCVAFAATLRSMGRPANYHIRSADLEAYLLAQFKNRSEFPHWPYTSKDSDITVAEALFVSDQPDGGRGFESAENPGAWWRPGQVSATQINRWINLSYGNSPPVLFKSLNVRLKNNQFPSITLHTVRKYHHTTALLAGIHEVFADELAGRKSGKQSDHYDLRTPHEILAQSIDTFDPDEDFDVLGPVQEGLANVALVDRKVYLFENAAPKHLTEIGGCATDWSLDPCKQYGDCMRCDQHLWRKGDAKRISHLKQKRLHAIKMVQTAAEKMRTYEDVPHSLKLQHQQFKDDLERCDAILAVEQDEKIPIGTIVTFGPAVNSITSSQRTGQLRHQETTRNEVSKD